MVAAAGDVLLDQRPLLSGAEDAELGEARLGEDALEERSQVLTEPARDREAESLLRPVHDIVRHVAAGNATERVLERRPPQLQTHRQSCGELGELVIDERRTRLQPVRHRHPVDQQEQVLGETRQAIGAQHPVDRLIRRRAEVREHLRARVGLLERRQDGRLEQHRLLLRGEAQDGKTERVSLAAGQERHLVHPVRLLRERLVAERVRQPADQPAHHRPPDRCRHDRVQIHQSVAGEPVVAGEHLVATVAGEHHLHLRRGQFGYQVHPERVRIARFIHVPDQSRKQAHHVGLRHALAMPRPPALGHLPCPRQFVVLRVAHADREGIHRIARLVGQHPRHQRRVDAAAQERADRHVGNGVREHRFAQSPLRLAQQRLVILLPLLAVRQFPVALDAQLLVLEHERVPRRQLPDPLEQRALVGNVAERHVVKERLEVGLGRGEPRREDRLDLRGEREDAWKPGEEERLLPEPVARREQPLARRIPDREGEHSAQRLHAPVAVPLVEREEDLGIAGRPEAETIALELGAQLPVVVDLAVEGDVDAAVGHRLLSAGKVDDAQPPVSEPDPVEEEDAGVVGTTMGDDIRHAGNTRAVLRIGG